MAARILIIEDDAPSRELASYLLQAFGYTVFAAEDGGEGLRMALAEIPDLIICDMQMPVMDGEEVLRQLRATPSTKDLTVIALSAHSMMGDSDKALASGFDAYFSKPIEPQKFVSQIEGFLPANLRAPPRA